MAKLSMKTLIGKGYDDFVQDRHFWLAVKGSRASKKSTTIAYMLIARMLLYPWTNILVLRAYGNTNRNSTFPQFKRTIYKMGLQDQFKFNETLPRITYKKTGQAILFGGLDDPLKMTSIAVDVGELNTVWLEEAYQADSWDDVQTIAESIRGHVDDPNFFNQFIISLNPWSADHWIKEKFFDEETKVPNSAAYSTTYKVNEFLSSEVVERMETLYETDPRRAKIALDGDWGIDTGLVFENQFEIRKLAGMSFEGMDPIVGIDFGWENDPSVITKAYVDWAEMNIYVVDSWTQKQHASTMDIWKGAQMLGVQHLEAYADHQEARTVAAIRSLGWKQLYLAPKGKGSVEAGVNFMKDFNWVIDPKNELVVEEFNNYAYETDKTDKITNKPRDKYNHSIDALRYSLITKIGTPNANYGAMSPENQLERLRRVPGLSSHA